MISCAKSGKTDSLSSENSSSSVVRKYTIHYDLGDAPNAEILAPVQEVIAGEAFELAIPHAEGYLFERWTDLLHREVLSGIYTYESDLYLTAVWQKDESGNGWSQRI